MNDTITLFGATLPDGRTRDVVLRNGRICVLRAPAQPYRLARAHAEFAGPDLTGYLLLPAPAEPHLHLDRALTWQPVGSDPDGRDGAIRSWQVRPARYALGDLRRRSRDALRALIARGVTAVRTHLDVGDGRSPLRAVEVMADVRAEFRHVLDLQIVALPVPGTSDRAIVDAVSAGADVIGGRPRLALDCRHETRRLLRLADRAEVGVDLHVDDGFDPRVLAVGDLARLVRASGFDRPVTANHLAGLNRLAPSALGRVGEAIAASGMSVVALPSPRGGGLPIRELLAAGIPVAAGGDRLRDTGHPMGRVDPLATAAATGLAPDRTWAAVSTHARRAMGLEAGGIEPGAPADLLAIRASSLAQALRALPRDRIVIKAGRVVTRSAPGRRVRAAA
ncbi:amidohydrolase family protein [Streptomyces sp. SID3343]|uniref:amidohydrolase family protein n=1 Tax=Streptomyces sp. SID3343 TaxID=2690260 RepID=UPI00136D23B4|nr:amidohydrolase family protein [Streptomyces sp. SID3343]MYV98572.1 cytosine deaminase [Streptomyces sp. SID3343]